MRTLAIALAVMSAVGLARPALADETPPSSIAQVMVVEPGSRHYRLFRGAIWLAHDKQQTSYRWGGLHCQGRDLSDSSVQLLFASFRSEYSVMLEYVVSAYKDKQYRCITAFTVSKS